MPTAVFRGKACVHGDACFSLAAAARHRARALQNSRHEAEITCRRCLNKIAKLNL